MKMHIHNQILDCFVGLGLCVNDDVTKLLSARFLNPGQQCMMMIEGALYTGNCKLMFVIKHIFLCMHYWKLLSSVFYLLPDEGYYQSGRFQFEIDVPEAYNMVVSGPVISHCFV